MLAFRCKNCGHLHPAEHAGEIDLPHACVVCGAGVTFSPKGVKSLDPDNWEVLADASPERLEELGLAPDEVARHEGGKPSGKEIPRGRRVAREANDGSGVKDQV